MRSTIDVLFLRKPRIDYISPPVCDVIFSASGGPVIVLNPLTPQSYPTGLILGGFGGFTLSWNTYPGAICYSVYQASDPDNAFGSYVLIAECIPNPSFDLSSGGGYPAGYYRVSVITTDGESPLSLPIFFDGVAHIICPSTTGDAPEMTVLWELGTDVTLGPFPVDEGFAGGPVTYRWFRDSTLVADTTNTSRNYIELPDLQESDKGLYTLHLGNLVPGCAFVSDPISLNNFLPVAWWKMEEVLDQDRIDALGSGFNLVDADNMSNGAGKIGGAALFSISAIGDTSGMDGSAVFGSIDYPDPNGLSVAFWMKVADFDANSYCNLGTIAIFGVGGGSNFLFGLTISWVNNILTASLTDAFQVPYATATTPLFADPTTWYFVCVVHDATSGEIRIRVNALTPAAGGTYLQPEEDVNGVSINVGAFGINASVASDTTFLLDEYSIWPFTLSDSQQDFIYNEGAGHTWPIVLPP